MNINRSKTIKIAELLIVSALCFFPLCYKIDGLPIRQWDESRNAVNSIEMLQNHNYLVRYYRGEPEFWEVKPPFLIWLQVISLKAFGLNEFAIRFPTILAGFLTVFLLIFYFHRYQGNRYIGYFAALILVTTQGYVNWHIARTGDHDALLILFTTSAILVYYEFISRPTRNNYLLVILSFLFIAGVLNKSVAMLLIVPGMAVATFLFKAQKRLFKNPWFYFALLIFLAGIGIYYISREFVQPGYLKAVWQWELLPRYTNSEDKFNNATFWYYAIGLYKSRYTWWILFLVLSMLIMPLRDKNRHNLYNYLLISSIVFFLVISSSTKNVWYDGPLFPLFAMMIALFIFSYVNDLQKLPENYQPFRKILVPVIFILLLIYPGIKIMEKVSNANEYYWDTERYALAYYLKDPVNLEKIRLKKVDIVGQEYNAHIQFYVDAINLKEKNTNLSIIGLSKIEPNNLLLCWEKSVVDSIKNKYECDLVEEKKSVFFIRIHNLKRRLLNPPEGK
jgi:4-amino-4-deoxy-L-arabinose transferase-like glycosyltransferase